MKKKTIETKKEIIEYKDVYVAVDGTEFIDENECKKFEESALGVVQGKMAKLIVSNKYDAWEAMGGCDDHKVFGLKLKKKADVDLVAQWFFLAHSYVLQDAYKGCREAALNKIQTAYETDGILIMGENYDGEWYIVNARTTIIENLKKLEYFEKTEE